jgi:hypothetical protein
MHQILYTDTDQEDSPSQIEKGERAPRSSVSR